MNHFDITPVLRDQKKIKLQRKAKGPTFAFFALTTLPLLVYFLFHFGVFKSLFKSPIQALEEATSLVTTNTGVGTGFLVSNEKLLTARHVVEELNVGESVNLLFENVDPPIETTAIIEWIDETPHSDGVSLDYFLTDVALLKLVEPELINNIKPMVLGSSDDIPNLTPIIAIGYPSGDYSITEGNINSDNVEGKELFKLDAATNPGNSGGPIISKDDHTVIGMLVGQRGGIIEGENVANKINNILNLIENGGKEI